MRLKKKKYINIFEKIIINNLYNNDYNLEQQLILIYTRIFICFLQRITVIIMHIIAILNLNNDSRSCRRIRCIIFYP